MYGALNMTGNVFEWVADWLSETYCQVTLSGGWNNQVGPATGAKRILKGGSYLSHTRPLRVSNPEEISPEFRYNHVGFRCVFSSKLY